jgi:ABC-type sugar transport system ATPase subunit
MPAPGKDPATLPDPGGAGTRAAEAPLVLRVTGVAKAFPGVQAIRTASLEVRRGEIHALVGENGAGKSTLIKVVTGAHRPDRGTVELNGRPVRISDPRDALHAGVAAIYQEFDLIPALSARENLFLGREPRHRLDVREERRRAREVFDRLGIAIDPEALVRDLPVAHQQLVEIARALLADARLLIMDEPTAALTPREVETLFGILADLRRREIGILFISHRLDEVFHHADRVTVMRDGATLGTWPLPELTREALIEKMVGRPLEAEFPKVRAAAGVARLTVRGLRGGRVREATFAARAGEVLGIAGLVGAGRTDLVRLIFGADRPEGGTVLLDGQPVTIRSPWDAIRRGICLLTEDRANQGLVLGLSARENFALPNLGHWSRVGWIAEGRERAAFLHYVESLNIRVAGPEQAARHLSGGNQQKLLVARWLESDSRVVIFDEPTRGIDVGAKYEMYLLINDLAARGKAIVMISSELPEILGMSDRVLVMHQGRITGEITDVAGATQEQVLELAVR